MRNRPTDTALLHLIDPIDAPRLAAAWSASEVQQTLYDEIFAAPMETEGSLCDAVPHRRRTSGLAHAGPLLTAGALTLALIAALVFLPSRAPAAFATWTPTPEPASGKTLTALMSYCTQGWSGAPDLTLTSFMADPGPPTVTDVRGDAAMAVWALPADGRELRVSCLGLDSDGDGAYESGAVGGGLVEADSVGPPFAGSLERREGMDVESWNGYVADDVSRVIITRADGVDVEASLSPSGLFTAFWAGDARVDRITAHRKDGTEKYSWSYEWTSR